MALAQAPSSPAQARRIDLSDPLRRALLACAAAFVLAALVLPAVLAQPATITVYFFAIDSVCLVGIGAFLGCAALVPAPARLGAWTRLAAHPTLSAAVIALAAAAAALGGTFAVQHGIGLSADEAMAAFDARIFLGGHLLAPLAPEWRGDAAALAPNFVLPVPGSVAWSSSYLPVNAALRAGFALLGSPTLTGPALAAMGILATVGIARRLWPDRPDAAIVAALMLATSPQVLVAAMTPYAMTAHLALNLVWLLLFLRGGRLGHGGAIAVGFLACGLHQVVFHPLFAAPVLFGLVASRRWRLAAFYVSAYALIGAFWILYWQGVLAWSGYTGSTGDAVGAGYMKAKIVALIAEFDPRGLDVMAMNLVRFAAWQSPLLLPLALAALPAIRRGAPVTRGLAAGLALTVAAMFVLLPFQGHGWGYRYLHGLIGSIALLAAQGWVEATRGIAAPARAAAAATLGLGWLAACAILLPVRAGEAERLVAPYAGALAAIAAAPERTVLVDAHALVYGADLVRNDPYLADGRAVLMLQALEPARVAELCARGPVALFGPAEGARFGLARPGAVPAALPPACDVRPVR